MRQGLQFLGAADLVQIAVLACAYYYIFIFFRGTRGAQVLVGLALVLMMLMFLTQVFHLDALAYIVRGFSVYLVIALVIIFHPEIRRALAELGRQPVFAAAVEKRNVVDHIVQAVEYLAEHKVGALIAVERDIGTRAIQESGTRLDSPVVPELLCSLFFPHTPLHDGGVIVSGNRIRAAGCMFPLSHRTDLMKSLGMRHRAAVGMSEETDAIVVVVSEETGTLSVSYRGRLSRSLDGDKLRRFLSALLLRDRSSGGTLRRMQEQLDLTPEGIAKSETRAGREKEDAD